MNLTKRLSISVFLILIFAGSLLAAPHEDFASRFQNNHPAIGSWFGKAVQLCASADTCQNVALFMTPTLTQDLQFLGNDSLALGGPPFGPHTTAHGKWVATGPDSIVADYVFMLPGSTTPLTIQALRFKWQAAVTDFNTMQGYVNIFFGPPVPVAWENLTAIQYPSIPPEGYVPLNPPQLFFKDPAACQSGPPACPLIFKFTIKRVTQ